MSKRIIPLLLILAAACSPLIPNSPSLSADLTAAEGDVRVRQAAAEDFIAAKPVLALYVGSEVHTLEDGRAQLDFSSGTIVRLSPRTRFTLADNRPQPDGLWTRLRLEAGELWIILRGGQLEVETPAGLSAVRGSLMSTAFDENAGDTRVTCLEGHCQVQTPGGTVDLTAGEAALLPADGSPPQKSPMTPEDYARWLSFNPEAAEVIPATPTPTPAPSATPTAHPAFTPTVAPSPTSAAACLVTTGFADGVVNLRSCPALSCAVLATAPEGASLPILSSPAGDWLQVRWQDTLGWIHQRYCP